MGDNIIIDSYYNFLPAIEESVGQEVIRHLQKGAYLTAAASNNKRTGVWHALKHFALEQR